MGMFDNVDFQCLCPACEVAVINGFQSKSGPCDLYTIKPWDTDDFYTNCPYCGAWVEFQLKPDAPDRLCCIAPRYDWIMNYNLRVEKAKQEKGVK